jgi:ribonucleotide reductase beta subunit family protein with ferritin-like domain
MVDHVLTERDTNARLNLFPIQECSRPFWDMYKITQKMLWFTEEIDLTQDVKDFKNMSPDEKHFLEMILAFFAQADSIVNENVITRLYNDVKDPAARAFYGLQIAFENVHSETYNVILDTLIQNVDYKNKLFRSIETVPAIKKKAQFALDYIESDEPFAKRVAAFACVEGIQFSSSFCAIYWLKTRGLLPGVTFSNELISRDEGMHCQFSILIYNSLTNKLKDQELIDLIKTTVELELEFIDEALRCPLIGMNPIDMKQYVKFVGDSVCAMFKIPNIYNVTNPFAFMETISLLGKTNFFEKRVSEYQKNTSGYEITDDIFNQSPSF